jgi:hypothetical protein
MTPYQREIIIRTIMGEAANEGPQGWAAVGHVIKNRTSDPRWPQDPASVALQPQQFSAWNDGHGGNDLVRKYGPETPLFQKIGAVVDQVWSGDAPDPTGGATHYYAPAGMPGGREPRWFDNITKERGDDPVTIGGHIFTGRRHDGGTEQWAPKPVDEYARSPMHPDMAQGIVPPSAAPSEFVPQQGQSSPFDWQGAALGAAGGLMSALGGGSPDRAAAQEAQLLDTYNEFDNLAARRRAWANSFDWL